jgi:hypothetical protein
VKRLWVSGIVLRRKLVNFLFVKGDGVKIKTGTIKKNNKFFYWCGNLDCNFNILRFEQFDIGNFAPRLTPEDYKIIIA